ncbi:hypothetical protein DRN75_00855 [Nanoarchaeota archaeon]|nr:MAG: hypothetical protein DRN75_00855 [Nanoarchaeota archaeon]
MFCDGCVYLNPTEEEQTRHQKHYCRLYMCQVFHQGYHPKIVKLDICRKENLSSFDIDDAVVMSNGLLAKLDGTDEGLKNVRSSLRDAIMMVYKLGLEHGDKYE